MTLPASLVNMRDILITEDLFAKEISEILGKRYEILTHPTLWDKPELAKWLGEFRAVVIRNQTILTREILEGAVNLKVIGRVGVGLDNIDVAAASEMGIVVVAPLDANAVSVAELTMGLLLGLARKIPAADRSTKAGAWDRRACT